MSESQKYLENADNCADLAELAQTLAERKRFLRMKDAWLSLAESQAWLDGEVPAQRRSPNLKAV
jgi:hypothetical protein